MLRHRSSFTLFALLCFNARIEGLLELRKCCKDPQAFDVDTESCIALDNATRYKIDPAVIDSESLVDDNEDRQLFKLRGDDDGFPACPYGSKRSFLLNHPENDAESGSFYVDKFDGSLIDAEAGKDHQTFCVDRGFVTGGRHQGTVAVVCRDDLEIACRIKPCIRQCCHPPLVFDVALAVCRKSRAEADDPRAIFNPSITTGGGGGKVDAVQAGAIFLYGNPSCPVGAHKFNLTRKQQLIILDSGRLRIESGLYDHTEYCINHVEEEEEEEDGLRYWSQALVCVRPEVRRWENLVDFRLVSALLVISVVFLTALAALEMSRGGTAKLFGAMRLCAISMLIVLYVSLAVIKFDGEEHVRAWPKTCVAEGLLVQFSYLSTACWMNAMSFSVWFNFRNVRTAAATASSRIDDGRRGRTSGFRNKKFKWFALYAWGLPTVVLIVTLTMQFLPQDGDGVVLPQIGATRCFLADGWPTLVYFHAVSLPVLLANCLFFFLFLHNLMFGVWAKKSRDPEVREQHWTRLKIVAKMFFVVGLTWICDVAAWALEWAYGRGNATVYRFASCFKIVNALQGVVLFGVMFFDDSNKTIRRRCFRLCNEMRRGGGGGGATATARLPVPTKNGEWEMEERTKEETTKTNAVETT